jgi:WD40 repeat protein
VFFPAEQSKMSRRIAPVLLMTLGMLLAGCGRLASPPAAAKGGPPAPPPPPRVELPVPAGTLIVEGPQLFYPSAITISSDGKYLFANDPLGAAVLWEIAGGQAKQVDNIARQRPGAFNRAIQRGVLSPDGSRLAALFGRQIVIVRTPDIQQEVCSIDRDGASSFLCFTPDSSRLISLESGGWRIFDAGSGKEVANFYPIGFAFFTHLGFDAGRNNALVAGASGLGVIELASGKVSQPLSFRQPPEGYADAGVSDDGRWIAATAADRVDIWDAQSNMKTATWPMTKQHHSPLITSDGKFVILADQTQLFVWDVATKTQVATWDVQGYNLGLPLLADKAGQVAAFSSASPQIRVFSLPK